MTEVTFHFNAPDKLTYVARLVRKALKSGAQIAVKCENDRINLLDDHLWLLAPTEFLPHSVVSSERHIVSASPVLLCKFCLDAPHRQVVVNTSSEVPEGFSQFDRLIEVVTDEDEDKRVARGRWKYYADRGYVLNRYDIAARGDY